MFIEGVCRDAPCTYTYILVSSGLSCVTCWIHADTEALCSDVNDRRPKAKVTFGNQPKKGKAEQNGGIVISYLWSSMSECVFIHQKRQMQEKTEETSRLCSLCSFCHPSVPPPELCFDTEPVYWDHQPTASLSCSPHSFDIAGLSSW